MRSFKKRISLCMISLMLIMPVSACSDSRIDRLNDILVKIENADTANNTVTTASEDVQVSEGLPEEVIFDESLNNTIAEFLGDGNEDFFKGYPIDENFLLWFAGRYGTDVLEKLAQAASSGDDAENSDIWFENTGNSLHVLMYEYQTSNGMLADDADCYHMVDAASEEQTVLGFTGDMNFDDSLGTMANYRNVGLDGIIDPALSDIMKSVDVMTVNCECALSDRGEPLAGKSFTFRGKPENASIMSKLGVDVAGIANNHVWDFGEEAVCDTIDALDAAGLIHIGAGKNLDEAKKPVFFIANGRKIAIVAATQIERSYDYTKQATEDMAGVLKTLDPELFCKVISDAKAQSDVVIVFVHWGTETVNTVDSTQTELAEAFVSAGADAIVGAHPHVLQGMEFVRGVPCMYSLGNFWFGSTPVDGVRKRDTGLLEVIVDREGELTFRFLPCVQEQQHTTLITEETEKERIRAFEESISMGVDIDENGFVTNIKDTED